MFILVGAGSRQKKKAYLGVRICPQCGRLSHYYLMEQAQQVSLFLVPMVRWNKQWAIICSRCHAGFAISEQEKDYCLKQARTLPDERQMNEVIDYMGTQFKAMNQPEPDALRERVDQHFSFHVDDRSFREIFSTLSQCRQSRGDFDWFSRQ